MKKLLLLFAAIFMAAGITKAQDATPLFVADGAVVENEEWAAYAEGSFPSATGIKVEAYEGYMIVRGVAGVAGYDLMVEFDENDNVTALTPIKDGVEGEPVSNGYCTFYTGLEGSNSYFQPYVASGYCYAGIDTEDNSGYLLMMGYDADGKYICFYMEFAAEEPLPEGCLYRALGETGSTEGWGTSLFPSVRDVKVEAYDGYFIVRAWAGVEGYDLMVEVGEDDAIVSVTPIINGEEGTPVSSGYVNLYTGREDLEYFEAYLAPKYGYAGIYEENSGYLIMSGYIGEEWSYYYLAWPQDEEGGGNEWVNPFEGEATLLYSAVAKTGSVEEEDPTAVDAWGASVFPVVENIKVDVYDKYIYIHALGGVEGYDAKVAYNESEEIPSIISVTNGEESEPCKSYIYLYTGREDVTTVQAYPAYSYAASYEDKSGYVLLGAWIYKADDSSDWNYYYIAWENGSAAAISSIVENSKVNGTVFNLAGQKVNDNFKGIIINYGKKMMNK